MKMSSKSVKYINIVTSPFRAIHASLVVVIGEVLSLGVLSPHIKIFWKYIYSLLELNELDEADVYDSIDE